MKCPTSSSAVQHFTYDTLSVKIKASGCESFRHQSQSRSRSLSPRRICQLLSPVRYSIHHASPCLKRLCIRKCPELPGTGCYLSGPEASERHARSRRQAGQPLCSGATDTERERERETRKDADAESLRWPVRSPKSYGPREVGYFGPDARKLFEVRDWRAVAFNVAFVGFKDLNGHTASHARYGYLQVPFLNLRLQHSKHARVYVHVHGCLYGYISRHNGTCPVNLRRGFGGQPALPPLSARTRGWKLAGFREIGRRGRRFRLLNYMVHEAAKCLQSTELLG